MFLKETFLQKKNYGNSIIFSYMEAILSCHHQCLHSMQTEDKRRLKNFVQVTMNVVFFFFNNVYNFSETGGYRGDGCLSSWLYASASIFILSLIFQNFK